MPTFSVAEQARRNTAELAQPLLLPIRRRSFFKYAGATAGATALVLAGCKKEETAPAPSTVIFTAGDVGILNYAYALEQLGAAFYAQVLKTPPTDFQAGELAYFTQIATHEAIHRDFFKAAITRDAPGQLIPDLTFNFSAIDFTKRASVLSAAQAFEDLGVQAYNGAGALLKNPAYLVLAGKIVSVEARHAAYIHDLIAPGDAANFFAGDNVTEPTSGLDRYPLKPTTLVAAAQKYIVQTLDASQLG